MEIFLHFSTKYLQITLISLILKVTVYKYYTMCKNHLINNTHCKESEVNSFISPIKNKKEVVTMKPVPIKNLLSFSTIIKIILL